MTGARRHQKSYVFRKRNGWYLRASALHEWWLPIDFSGVYK